MRSASSQSTGSAHGGSYLSCRFGIAWRLDLDEVADDERDQREDGPMTRSTGEPVVPDLGASDHGGDGSGTVAGAGYRRRWPLRRQRCS